MAAGFLLAPLASRPSGSVRGFFHSLRGWGKASLLDGRFFAPYEEIRRVRARARRILGVSDSAGLEEIKRAFRALALGRHPDINGSDGDFFNVVNAYLVLTRADPRGFVLDETSAASSDPPESHEEYLARWKEKYWF